MARIANTRRLVIALLGQVTLCLALAPVIAAQQPPEQDARNQDNPPRRDGVTIQAARDAANVRPEDVSDPQRKPGNGRGSARNRRASTGAAGIAFLDFAIARLTHKVGDGHAEVLRSILRLPISCKILRFAQDDDSSLTTDFAGLRLRQTLSSHQAASRPCERCEPKKTVQNENFPPFFDTSTGGTPVPRQAFLPDDSRTFFADHHAVGGAVQTTGPPRSSTLVA